MNNLLASLLLELDANDRLRYGVYVIAFGLTVYLLLVLADVNRDLLREQRLLTAEYEELQGIEEQSVWQSRLDREAETQAALLTQTLWRGPSENQTLAAIQSTLRKLSDSAGMEKLNVRMGSPRRVDEELGIHAVRARIRGAYNRDDALRLVAAIEDFQPALVLDSLTMEVKKSSRGADNRFSADVSAYYMTDPEGR